MGGSVEDDFDTLLMQALDLERRKEDYLLKMRLHRSLACWIPDIDSWINRPNGYLGGRRPSELIGSGEVDRLVAAARFDAGFSSIHTTS